MSHSLGVINAPRPSGLAEALSRLATCADPAAWEVIVRDAGPHLWRIARAISHDQDAADDAVQETLLLVRDHARGFRDPGQDSDRAALRWLMGIAVHTVSGLSRRRSRRREQPLAQAMGLTASPGPATASMTASEALDEASARRQRLHEELNLLPSRLREPVLMHYIAGLPVSEVAATLGITLGNAKVRIHRGLHRLRERIAASRPQQSLMPAASLLPRHPQAPVFSPSRCLSLLRSPQASTLGLPTGSHLLEMSMIAKCAMIAGIVCAVGVIPALSGQEAVAHPVLPDVISEPPLAAVSVDPATPPAELLQLSRTLARHVTLIYDRIDGRYSDEVGEVLHELSTLGGLNYMISADVIPQQRLTLHLVDASISEVMATMSRICHLHFAYAHGVITVSHDVTAGPTRSSPVTPAAQAMQQARPSLNMQVAAVRDAPDGAQDLVILTCARRDPIAAGSRFVVHHDAQYLCIVRTEREFNGMITCRVEPGTWNIHHLQIALGDAATDLITPVPAEASSAPARDASGTSF